MNDIVICDQLPDRHRPVEKCAVCHQSWPCVDEQARVKAVEAAQDAALVLKQVTDVPPETVGEKEMGNQ